METSGVTGHSDDSDNRSGNTDPAYILVQWIRWNGSHSFTCWGEIDTDSTEYGTGKTTIAYTAAEASKACKILAASFFCSCKHGTQ
jgi:hypothetical protein